MTVSRSARQLLILERFRGTNGTIINPHRSIATIPLRAADVIVAIVLGVGASAIFVLELDLVGRGWTWAFDHLASPLGFAGIRVREIDIGSLVALQLPTFFAVAAAPTPFEWWLVLIITAIVVIVSFLVPDRWLPLAYALRLAALVQTTALLFFFFHPWAFPYDLSTYITTMEVAAIATIAITPLVLGLTYYVIDARFRQKLGLTLAVMGHLIIFVPLQYALQSYIIAHGSLLMMPLCFSLFALLPEVMIFIAFYGWGMSWPSRQLRERRE
ncbi:MAG TPA: hypothetical protein VGM82_16750 [Gemmatimonadaceae bacterium]|jgi:hypothetical protein